MEGTAAREWRMQPLPQTLPGGCSPCGCPQSYTPCSPFPSRSTGRGGGTQPGLSQGWQGSRARQNELCSPSQPCSGVVHKGSEQRPSRGAPRRLRSPSRPSGVSGDHERLASSQHHPEGTLLSEKPLPPWQLDREKLKERGGGLGQSQLGDVRWVFMEFFNRRMGG